MYWIILILFLIYLIYALGVWFFVLIGVIILVVIIYPALSSPSISSGHKNRGENHYDNTSIITASHRENDVLVSQKNEKHTTHIHKKSQTQLLSEFVLQLLEHNLDIATLKAVSRMQKYESSFIKSSNADSRAFDLLISCAENTIKTAGLSNHKRRITAECNLIIYIAKELKAGASNEQIIKSILNTKQDINTSKSTEYNPDTSNDIATKINAQKELINNFISLSNHTNNQQLKSSIKSLERCISSFMESTWCKDDLFTHITGISNNTIFTSRHSPDMEDIVKECKTINYIIENLTMGQCADIIIDDIVRTSTINQEINDKIEERGDIADLAESLSICDSSNDVANQEIDNEIEKRKTIAYIIQSLSICLSNNNAPCADSTNDDTQNIFDNRQTVVPLWTHFYVYSVEDLNQANDKQKQFYHYFKSEFLNNNCLDIGGNSNYAFVLMFDLVEDYKKHKDLNKVQEQLAILSANYPKTARYTKQTLDRVTNSDPSHSHGLSITINVSDILTRINDTPQESKEKLIQKSKWISKGEKIEVHGIQLQKGNFYIGEKFLLPKDYRHSWSSESPYILASVLNAELAISIQTMPEAAFSSYSDMTPYWRYQYLQWLSGEVSPQDVPIDILFLYLHGLEIRMFIDTETTKSQRKDILENIVALKPYVTQRAGVYDYAIKSFFDEFIDCAITKYFPSSPLDFVTKTELYDCRTYQCFILDQAVQKNKGLLSCESAYNIAINTLNFSSIAPLKFFEFIKIRFEYYFNNELPKGLQISTGNGISRQCYSIMHRNITNKSFETENRYISCDIFDSSCSYWEASSVLRDIYWKINREFSLYNKVKEGNDYGETLFALFALPNYVNIQSAEKVIAFKSYLENILGDNDYVALDIDAILAQWEYCRKEEKTLPKKSVDTIIGGFNILGYGIAPDYNIDKKRFGFGDQCIIFRSINDGTFSMNNIYARTELFVKMAAQVLYPYDNTTEERCYVQKYIASQNDSKRNQKQVFAYFEWLMLNKQRYESKLKDVIPLLFDEIERIEICDALIGLCCIGGSVNSNRVEIVKKALPLFGVDSSDIHSRIHRIFTGEIDDFVTIEKKSDASEFSIPQQETTKPKFYIDTKKLSKIEEQTFESQKILSEIFDKEEACTISDIPSKLSVDLEILELLLSKESWNRSDVEAICMEKNLMVGSLLEKLNDYSYSKINDNVIDDCGDIIYVTTVYKEQLI